MGTKEDAIALYAGGYTYRQIEKMPGMPSRMTLWRWVNGRHDGAPGAEADGRRTGMAKRGNGKPGLPRVVGDGPTYPDIDPEDKDALIERLQLENDILRGTQEVFKRTRPWLFDEQGEIRADRVAEGEYRETLERTHRFLEDIEELL